LLFFAVLNHKQALQTLCFDVKFNFESILRQSNKETNLKEFNAALIVEPAIKYLKSMILDVMNQKLLNYGGSQ
jgi:hypothetical protein